MEKHAFAALFMAAFFPFTLAAQKADPATQKQWKEKFGFAAVKSLPVTPVKDQAKSGTCWDYAGISFVESEMLRMGKKPVDLSEMYVAYKAYQGKADKYVRMHGNMPFSPGGEGTDVLDVIRMYGAMPQEAYMGLTGSETANDHGELHKALSAYVKSVVASRVIRGDWKKGFDGILDRYLGELPSEFTYRGKKYTPRTFADKVVGINPSDYMYFMSWTYEPYYKKSHLLVPDNWTWEKYYNIPLDDMMRTLDYALDNGYTAMWSADMTEDGFSVPLGIAVVPQDPKDSLLFDGPKPEKEITEQMRQQAFDDYSTVDDHAMHITGIARDVNGKKYYIVKNSWGTEKGFSGMYYVSEAYVRYKTICIVLHKDGVPSDVKGKLR